MVPGVCQAEEATSVPQSCPLQEAKALDTKGRPGDPQMPHVLHRLLEGQLLLVRLADFMESETAWKNHVFL